MPRKLDRTLRTARRPRRAEERRKASGASSRPAGALLDYDAVVDIAVKTFWSLHPAATLPVWFDECASIDAQPDTLGRWRVDLSLHRRNSPPLLVFSLVVTPDGSTAVELDTDPATLKRKDFVPAPVG